MMYNYGLDHSNAGKQFLVLTRIRSMKKQFYIVLLDISIEIIGRVGSHGISQRILKHVGRTNDVSTNTSVDIYAEFAP